MTIDFDMIDDYLANRLSDDDLESFEIDMLDSPELQEAVLTQKALKEGLATQTLASQTTAATKKNGPVSAISNFVFSPVWSCAATILLGISAVFLFLDADKGGSNIQIDRITYVETLRSSTSPTYSIQANESNLLVVDVNPTASGPFQVSLQQNNTVVFQQTFAKATDYSLNIIAPVLAVGNYTLIIEDESNAAEFTIAVE